MTVYPRKKNGEVVGWVADVRVTLPDGSHSKQIRRLLKTERQARSFEFRMRKNLLEGTYGEKQHTTFSDFADEFTKKYVHVRNKKSEQMTKGIHLRVHLLPFFGKIPLSQIDEKLIADFIEHQQGVTVQRSGTQVHSNRKLSASTINRHLALLSIMLKTAVKWKQLKKIPEIARLKEEQPVVDYLEVPEERTLVEAAKDFALLWWSMLVVALNTGLRQGELLALRWRNIDFRHNLLTVTHNNYHGHISTPKSGKFRTIEINAKAKEALMSQRHLRGEWVWCREDGAPFCAHHLNTAIHQITKRAGLRKIGWHTLRHTFASRLVQLSVPLKTVQELLGHSDIETTMKYAHISPMARRSAVSMLEHAEEVYKAQEHFYSTEAKTEEPAIAKVIGMTQEPEK